MFELTFPEIEKYYLMEHYAKADSILEYGSGGSTLYGLQAKKKVITVESDQEWLNRLKNNIATNGLDDNFTGIHVDIGKTKDWGHPEALDSYYNFLNFPSYSIAPWLSDKCDPDFVLIDGRFRPACLFAVGVYTKKTINVLFDDYENRAEYHVVENYFRKKESAGRMALFEIFPNQVTPRSLMDNIKLFFNPN